MESRHVAARLDADDQLDVARIYAARISPDARAIAYEVRTVDRAADRDCSRIWLAERGTSGWSSRPLTSGLSVDSTPRWSPDGRRLALLSDRSGVSQVWVLDLAGGEPTPLTSLPSGVSAPEWSPDGTRLAFVALDARLQGAPVSPHIRHIRRIPFRTADGRYILDRFDHVWIGDVATGSVRQLTKGDWDDGSPGWSPAGDRIAFTSRRQRPVTDVYRTQVLVIDVSASAEADADAVADAVADAAQDLTGGLLGAGTPAWSPDGTRVIFAAQPDGPWLKSRTGIWSAAADGSAPPECLLTPATQAIGTGPEFEFIPLPGLPPTFTPDGGAILYSATEAGRAGL